MWKCKTCGQENSDANKTCQSCNAYRDSSPGASRAGGPVSQGGSQSSAVELEREYVHQYPPRFFSALTWLRAALYIDAVVMLIFSFVQGYFACITVGRWGDEKFNFSFIAFFGPVLNMLTVFMFLLAAGQIIHMAENSYNTAKNSYVTARLTAAQKHS